MKLSTRLALALLLALHAAVLGAGFLAPYPFAEQHRDFSYAPPTHIHFVDARGSFHARPFVYLITSDASGDYHEDPSRPFPIRFLRTPPRLFGVDGSNNAPGTLFLWGTDAFGRDVFSRVLYGGRLSILVGLTATLLSLALGLCGGLLAGFYGGWVDRLLMRGGELFLALPWLYLLLGVRALLPLQIGAVESCILLVGIIGLVGWVRPARLVRGLVLSARENGFVLAARGFGASGGYLLRRHILPLTWGLVLTQATVLIPQYILAEVTLSFLGLGVGEPLPSWGNILTEARQYHALVTHPWMLAPGFLSIPLVLCFFVLADSLMQDNSHKYGDW